MPIRARIIPFAAWLVMSVLIGLSGRYFGGTLSILRFTILLSAPLSVTYLAISSSYMRYNQDFDSDHPSKGSRVGYRLKCSNESWLPGCRTRFELFLGTVGSAVEANTVQLGPGKTTQIERTVHCPYRGVYNVGMARAVIRDPLGLVEFDMRVWHRTFYVRPRILQPSASIIRLARRLPGAARPEHGNEGDPSLFRELAEYRGDEDARRIIWKHYASRGIAVVRRYDSAVEPGLRLVLDTRPTQKNDEPDYECEDSSIELLVSIARACIMEGIPVRLAGFGIPSVSLSAGDEDGLEDFVGRSVGIFFQAPGSPLDFDASEHHGAEPTIYISHIPDNRLIDLISGDADRSRFGLVLNTSASPPRRARELRSFAQRMRSEERFCIAVHRADDLMEIKG